MRVHLIAPVAALFLAQGPAAHQAPEVVDYTCTTAATGATQQISVNVELTVPATVGVGENLQMTWTGSYAAGTALTAPATGLDGTINMYAYAGISGITGLTSATGTAQLGTIATGAQIPLPTTAVNLTTTPPNEGTGTVHVASINFGTTPQNPLIECEPTGTTTRTEHPLTVGAGGGITPTPTPTPTPTQTPTPTPDDTETEDTTPTATVTTTETMVPEGGADTGAGGEAGPDGRAFLLVGSVLILSSGAGLMLRRRPRRPQE
ncbi:MAG TPA: hypothetical protein VFV66_32900 [Nonomuraea sp.]|nr:hypothetical protein [Nonomuraea sp.]